MSEHINNRTRRQKELKRLIGELHDGKSVDDVKRDFAELIRGVSATEISEMEQALITEGVPETEIKRLCDVHVVVFRESLDQQAKPEAIPGHPVHTFHAENSAAPKVLEALKEALGAVKVAPGDLQLKEARQRVRELMEYEKHYVREENILFPYLERHNFSGPSSVMWAIHDDVRAGWKTLDEALAAGPGEDPATFNVRIDTLFETLDRNIREMFYKEERILFPTALEKLSEKEWVEIRAQESDVGYCYVESGDQWPSQAVLWKATLPEPQAEARSPDGDLLHLDVGMLTGQEVNWLLGHLPVDVTYVGKDDTVRFFSRAKERIFQRSPAIIGRKVQKCHPPASVHRVQQIVDDFRAGRSDSADFWIQMDGKFIYIRYFAIRDENGEYQGTLEVSQDVTDIRKLEGEQRLLDDVG